MVHLAQAPETYHMNSCACPAASLVSLRFAEGLVLLRCTAHEQQTWYVDGQPAERPEVLPALKDLFLGCRGERRTGRRTTLRPRVRRLHEPVAYDATPDAGDDERLTALLHSRGLSGTWAVA